MKGVKPGVMCKLDIEKAYDHVNWKFLLNTIRQMGFGEKWLGWIHFCISTVCFPVLVNGEPVGFCPLERGRRQGDPLTLLLFSLPMEGFDSMMRITIQNRWIKGFQIQGSNGQVKDIFHLLYADDTIIFCEPRGDQIRFYDLNLFLSFLGSESE